ncbi:MAG: nuclear transport factor 2 family protein [Proteobacteria bacterium]|nr:nuclear transport factor 2 family protein [Pseudomonadota bacterium]
MHDPGFLRTGAGEIFTAMNSRDLSGLARYLADDAVFDFPGAGCITGKKKILLFLKVLFRKYPRLRFTVEDMLIEGDRACAVWSNQGEDSHGTPYKNRGVTVVRIAQGKIIFISDYFKGTSWHSTAVPEGQETPPICCANFCAARWRQAPVLKNWLPRSLT